MYTKYLDKNIFLAHYFCFDSGLTKILLEDVHVKYCYYSRYRMYSYLKFFISSWKYIHQEKFDVVFHIKGKFSLIIRLLNISQSMVFDIRTGNLSENSGKRRLKNFFILLNSLLYKNVTIVSESLRKEINLNIQKVLVLPLGGEKMNLPAKTFDSINLLYIGSLNKRNIHHTILGLAEYIKNDSIKNEIVYDIIGFGNSESLKELNWAIEKTGLSDVVKFHGRKKITELLPFIEKSNCGIVYVPQADYYQCQPPTKLFEYLLAGIPVIATDTFENRINLFEGCGIITQDNIASFSKSLSQFIQNKKDYYSQNIKNKYVKSEWKNIVKDVLEPYLLKIGQ